MEFSTSTLSSDVAVVACDGRLNMVAAPHLASLLKETVDAGHPRVVIDLEATTFVDSSGLGALVGGLKQARLAGGDLRIARAGEQVLTVLNLTNLDRILRPYPTVEDATHGW